MSGATSDVLHHACEFLLTISCILYQPLHVVNMFETCTASAQFQQCLNEKYMTLLFHTCVPADNMKGNCSNATILKRCFFSWFYVTFAVKSMKEVSRNCIPHQNIEQ